MPVKGFTLMEVLVVLAILGVLSSIAAIAAWPGEAARAESEARRLATLLELGYSEARASGQAMAWAPEPGGYAFWRKSSEGLWERFPEESPYRARALSPGMQVTGARVVLSTQGVHAPVEARLSGGGTTILIRSQSLGRLSVQRLHPG